MDKNKWLMRSVCGIALGVLAFAGGVLVNSSYRSSEAAIAVYDAQNVAEAIKTAINTATILTETQKQLVLEILNTKRININTLASIFNEQKNADDDFLSGDATIGAIPGLLNKDTTVENVLINEIGSVQDVFDENKTLVDLYLDTQKNIKALEATYKDSVQAAENAGKSSEKLMTSVNEAVDTANNAEGQLQVQQAQIAVSTANFMETKNTNQLLSQLMASVIQKNYIANREKAIAREHSKRTVDELLNFAGVNPDK